MPCSRSGKMAHRRLLYILLKNMSIKTGGFGVYGCIAIGQIAIQQVAAAEAAVAVLMILSVPLAAPIMRVVKFAGTRFYCMIRV